MVIGIASWLLVTVSFYLRFDIDIIFHMLTHKEAFPKRF